MSRFERPAQTAAVGLAVTAIAIYVATVIGTIATPYQIQGMEGGALDVIARILNGQPVYVRPSVEYVPYRYSPLYFWVCAAVARAAGLSFLSARLVSLASTCGTAALIWAFVRREGGDRVDALAAVGLFAATFFKALRFFHLARIDSLFVFFLLAGWFVLRAGARPRSAVAAGILWWLAIETKQVGLIAVAAALPIAVFGAPRRVFAAGVACGALTLATTLIMDARTAGWWSYYLYRLPIEHIPYRYEILGFWRFDILRALPVAAAATGALLWSAAKRGGDWRRGLVLGGMTAGVVATGWGSKVFSGSAGNALMPMFAVLAILMPLGFRSARLERSAALGAMALQLALLLQASWPLMDQTAFSDRFVRTAGDRVVEFLGTVPGEVLIWDSRFIETRAGKISWGLEEGANDILASTDDATRDALVEEVVAACRSGRITGAIDPPSWLLSRVPAGAPIDLGVQISPGWPDGPSSRYYPFKKS